MKGVRIDVDKPLWSQDTFYGRFMHFAWKTDPTNIFQSSRNLYEAKELLDKYREKMEPQGTTEAQVSVMIVIKSKSERTL
jgi:hypothetical protein